MLSTRSMVQGQGELAHPMQRLVRHELDAGIRKDAQQRRRMPLQQTAYPRFAIDLQKMYLQSASLQHDGGRHSLTHIASSPKDARPCA